MTQCIIHYNKDLIQLNFFVHVMVWDLTGRQVQLVGDRLSFQRLSGEGPDTGWVSVKLKDKVLMEMLGSSYKSAAFRLSS